MKKSIVLVLLVPILAFGLISCDATMRTNLVDLMDSFSGNVYIDNGLVTVDTADAEAAAATASTIGSAATVETVAGGATTAIGGVSITGVSATTTLKPQTTTEQTTFQTTLADTLKSPTQTQTLLTSLKTTATSDQQTSAQGTVEVVNKSLDAIKTDITTKAPKVAAALESLKIPTVADPTKLTQADLMVMQLVTNLVSNTVAALNNIGGSLTSFDETTLAANKDKIQGVIDDALFTAQMVAQVSGAATIDFSGSLDLGGLIDSLSKSLSKGLTSKGDVALTDAASYMGTINSIVPQVVKLMGITKNSTSGDFEYTASAYNHFHDYSGYYYGSVYNASVFLAQSAIEVGFLKYHDGSVTPLILSALDLFLNEFLAFWSAEDAAAAAGSKPLDIQAIIVAYLNAGSGNKALASGTLTKDDVLTLPNPTTLNLDFNHLATFIKNRDSSGSGAVAYYTNLINDLVNINKSTANITQLTTALTDFRDKNLSDFITNL